MEGLSQTCLCGSCLFLCQKETHAFSPLSFLGEVMALSGCDLLTISPGLLQELDNVQVNTSLKVSQPCLDK